MIPDVISGWITSGTTWIVDRMPSAELPLDGLKTGWETLAALNYFLPIAETVAVVVAAIMMGPAFLVTTITFWVMIGILRGGQSKA